MHEDRGADGHVAAGTPGAAPGVRAAWRLEQAERERSWALASARAEGVSIRALAAAAGLSSSRVHQIVAAADLDELNAALGELRAAGWPAPEDPEGDDDAELDGRDLICDRLSDEVSWLRQCADWLAHLDADSYPPAVNLRPSADWPDRAVVAVNLARVRAVIDRIAADVDELARARRVQDLNIAAVLPGSRAERRRRLAEPTWSSGPSAPGGGCPLPRPATGAGLGRLAGRAVSARRDQPTTRLHRQPVPAPLTSTPMPPAHTRTVQETGRHSGADGSIVTDTPTRGLEACRGVRVRISVSVTRSPAMWPSRTTARPSSTSLIVERFQPWASPSC